jgi:hypothetical protein
LRKRRSNNSEGTKEQMATPQTPAPAQTPGFIAVLFDVPFPISIPNGSYISYDPMKSIAAITVTLKEGSRAFFRNTAITGPTSFEELRRAQQEPPRPREGRSYIAASRLPDGTQKATLNVNSGTDGGYAECKYYSEVCVTFLSDDLNSIGEQGVIFTRVCEILNPFLEKYQLLNDDYRISPVSLERNFYFATCHTSPLEENERQHDVETLFEGLQAGRTFQHELGHGAANILRANSYELLGPRNQLNGPMLALFADFIKEKYELPLSYELVLDALRYLQRFRDYRLAIVHAETAVEVHSRSILIKLMMRYGIAETQADTMIDTDRNYWGVKNKLRRLDEWSERYCADNGQAFAAFVDSVTYQRWETELYGRRNAAVHAGVNSFTYDQASTAIGIAKECVALLEKRIPGLQNRVQLNASMAGFRLNAGEVMF